MPLWWVLSLCLGIYSLALSESTEVGNDAGTQPMAEVSPGTFPEVSSETADAKHDTLLDEPLPGGGYNDTDSYEDDPGEDFMGDEDAVDVNDSQEYPQGDMAVAERRQGKDRGRGREMGRHRGKGGGGAGGHGPDRMRGKGKSPSAHSSGSSSSSKDPVLERLKPIYCNRNARFRTMDGTCNNLYNPCWGRAGETYSRLMAPHYGDGMDTPRESSEGRSLPNPRLVSMVITEDHYPTGDSVEEYFSDFMSHFGQMVSHEITSAVPYADESFVDGKLVRETPKCCHVDNMDDQCYPITINHSDKFYPPNHCMELVRSQPYNATLTYCSKNSPGEYREQINQVTSYMDCSLVYGNSDDEVAKLREGDGKGAKMKLDKSSLYIPNGLLPRDPESQCNSYLPGCNPQCFMSGDKRVSITPVITALQTLFVREHNYLVELLRYRKWPQEKIFQTARKIVIASYQVIVYKEYLPALMGPKLMHDYQLSIPSNNYYYNHSINPSVINSFASAAFRVCHSAIGNKIARENKKCFKTSRLSYDLQCMDEFCKPQTDPIRSLLVGTIRDNMQRMDHIYSKELTHYLFASPPNDYGKDLFAIDIHRSRDHGIPAYNSWRKLCGLRELDSFDDFKKEATSYDLVNKIRVMYSNNINELDLVIGGLLEEPLPGTFFGPTLTCIIGEQFYRSKYGDRFWFENLYHPGAFTKEELRDLYKVTLAAIICRNTDVQYIQPNVFYVPGRGNELRSCREILEYSHYNIDYFK